MDHNNTDIKYYLQNIDIYNHAQPLEDLSHGAIPQAKSERAFILHNHIATEIWTSYQQFLQNHLEILEQKMVSEDI